jgi:acetyl esterase/lipase
MPVLLPLLFSFLALTQFKPADSLWYWKLTLAASELAHLFLPLVLIWLLWAYLRGRKRATLKYMWVNYILAVLFAAVFLRPAITGYIVARENNLDFSILKLFIGDGYSPVSVTTREYKNTLTLDCYHPATPNAEGRWLLIVHGGGWDSGDSAQLSQASHYIADKMQTTVFSVNYHLAPAFQYPEATQDVADAIKYIQSKSAEFKINPDNYFLLGRSAGGQIAGEVGYNSSHYAISRPRGVILMYSPTDMVFGYEVGEENDLLKSRGLIRAYMGGPPETVLEKYKMASLTDLIGTDTPPTLLIHGQHDYLTWFKHTERLAWRLNRAHVKNRAILLPWATHGLDFFLFSPSGQISMRALDRFFNNQTFTSFAVSK